MSDRLHALLSDEADARVADAQVPPVAIVYARRRPRPAHRRRWGVMAPVAVAAAVLVVAAGAQLIASPPSDPTPASVVVPPPPRLGVVVPPLQVREKLGAQGGHSAGPAVPSGDALAVSQPSADGEVLRTVGVVRPLAVPDGEGRPRVDRCVSTYSDPGVGTLHGYCRWGGPADPETESHSVTLQIVGPPGATWVSGTAPEGTAAVVLRSPGLEQVVVATADPGPQWQHRPFYVAWWPRAGTDVVAVDAAGKELGRRRLPSDQPSRSGDEDPQLGTIETPLELQDRTGPIHRNSPHAPLGRAAPPTRLDVLAMLRLDATKTLFTLGYVNGSTQCITTYVQNLSGDAQSSGGGGSCGGPRPDASQQPPIQAARSYSAGTGKPEEQLLEGSAPAGTVTIRLAASDAAAREFPAFDGGGRWDRRAFFIAPWPSAPTTRVTALGADGQVLATTSVRGLNPHAFDEDFLAAQAACMQRAGAVVLRHPQPSSPPAYEFRHGRIKPADMGRVTENCEDAAADEAGP